MMTMLHIPKIFLLYLTAYAPLAAAQYKYTNYKLVRTLARRCRWVNHEAYSPPVSQCHIPRR